MSLLSVCNVIFKCVNHYSVVIKQGWVTMVMHLQLAMRLVEIDTNTLSSASKQIHVIIFFFFFLKVKLMCK